MTLVDAIRDLDAAMTHARGNALHLVPDLILYNLLRDVREQAEAAKLVMPSAGRRAAFANARAALESAIDCIYLTADEAAYDERGARARVFELVEAERLRHCAEVVDATESGANGALEQAVRADALRWDQAAAGQGRLLIIAWERCVRNPPAVGDHWSGHSRYELYRQMMGANAEGEDLVRMLDYVYGFLAVAAHPRPRTGERPNSIPTPGQLGAEGRDSEASRVADATEYAIRLAVHARARRDGFTA